MDKSFTVIIDTQEKQPWTLSHNLINGVKYEALKTGDYTVEGLEDILCIERKADATEIAMNVSEQRFRDCLERMSAFQYKFILLESSMQKVLQFPHLEQYAQTLLKKTKVRGKYILQCITRMQVKYGVHFVYCGNREDAQYMAINIMREVVNRHG